MTSRPSSRTRGSAPLSHGGSLYVGAVILAGLVTTLYSIHAVATPSASSGWLIFAALALLTGSFTIRVPSLPARISVSETFIFTCVLLFGPAPGTVAMALDGLIISCRRRYTLQRTLFNSTAPALSIWTGSQLFFALAGVAPLHQQAAPIGALILPLVVLTAAYFVLNSGFTAVAVAFETGNSAVSVWRQHFLWLSLNYFGGASVSLLLVATMRQVSFGAIGVILPLLVISYLTFRASMGRIEDANQHATQVGRLYQSTAETLAMAIDAKDEATHGHIRRVQSYALAVARALEVTDRDLINAIETAALLHDIGKLAVPEYILNKPGKLTPLEFEKMKLHVNVGADITSAIGFPYPVVPIVRHHHESWDGTGYPDGLKGEGIPIGARILAVVDCFDALTWDRPYRVRLSEEEAFEIVRERRGTMYDPQVVDAFMTVYKEIASHALDVPAHHRALVEISRSSMQLPEPVLSRRAEIALEATEEMIALSSLARSVSGETTFADAAFLIGTHLRRIVPCSTCAFFAFDPAADDLVARHVAGAGAARLQGLRIPRGHRLSGWVAANKQMMVNSDAALDLRGVVDGMRSPLRSCLSTPLLAGEVLVGVLTLYSTESHWFTDDQARVAQMLAPNIAQILRTALEFESLAGARTISRVSSTLAVPPPSPGATSPPLARSGTDSTRPALRVVKNVVH